MTATCGGLDMSFQNFIQLGQTHRVYRLKQLKKQLAQAESYAEWKEIGLKIDETSGAQEWKYDNCSPYFDAEVIAYRLNLLKRYRSTARTRDLLYILREGLSYDVANIAHPLLFSATYVGTKRIIEDYIDEVSQSLNFIASADCQELSLAEKVTFFEQAQQAYGQPALMFSGGSTLGLFHTGVCKALLEHDLMPKVLSGSSAGAIVTAMVGLTPSHEILSLLSGENLMSEAFKFRKVRDILRGDGGIADVKHLKKFLISNMGDVSFDEAFQVSNLNINVAVAPYDASQDARIMNSLTSPDLLVWSAVLASCAVPVLFPPVRLTSKRYDGQHTPYLANTRWVDGSVRSDFPQEKMARLYNINYTIASQTNPHVVPFMQDDEERYRKDVLSWPERIVRRQGKVLSRGVLDFTRERMGSVPAVRRVLDHSYGVLDQRYYGDVNIFGHYSLRHYYYLLQNPRPHLFKLLQREGERATWPKISMIEAHARVGKTIEHQLELLHAQQRSRSHVHPSSIAV